MNEIKTILWDWNGTLLDDTEICRNIINRLLSKRNLPALSLERYQKIFSFPIRSYYQKAGFDFSTEAFEKPADEFIFSYKQNIHKAALHDDAKEMLDYFEQKSMSQYVLSAMEQHALDNSIINLGIQKYFIKISGIENHYAHSKTDNAINLVRKNRMKPEEICLIGDTIHDHEVAQEIGCRCILIANGHQSKDRLLETGRIVLNSLTELKNHFNH